MKLINKLLEASGKKKVVPSNAFGATDVGKEREANEDYFRVIPEKNLYIVADGMGGHNAGDVASLNATKQVDAYFSLQLLSQIRNDNEAIRKAMIDSLLKAHEEILQMAEKHREYTGMGCTIVAALVQDDALHLSHVGDARAYVSSGPELSLLTTDHSYVMEMVKRGKLTLEEARVSPFKNRLNQAIGATVNIKPDYCHYKLEEGDKLLLCSDGLWDMLADEEILMVLREDLPPQYLCKKLVDMANNAGGHDNITALIYAHEKTKTHQAPTPSPERTGEYSYVFKEQE
ncbi:MAG: Stp1/IreP family PP2C-type Ser/Thr phosphatase [bacterium]|nr:Stp1/IreP family PP2C-type Ser/Thr phosphatase [bacterium]